MLLSSSQYVTEVSSSFQVCFIFLDLGWCCYHCHTTLQRATSPYRYVCSSQTQLGAAVIVIPHHRGLPHLAGVFVLLRSSLVLLSYHITDVSLPCSYVCCTQTQLGLLSSSYHIIDVSLPLQVCLFFLDLAWCYCHHITSRKSPPLAGMFVHLGAAVIDSTRHGNLFPLQLCLLIIDLAWIILQQLQLATQVSLRLVCTILLRSGFVLLPSLQRV